MSGYVSPMIIDNDDLAEGVYATGSGGELGFDCWDVRAQRTQQVTSNPSEKYSWHRIYASHHKANVEHLSMGVTYTLHITGEPATKMAPEGNEGNKVGPGGSFYGQDSKGFQYSFTLDSTGTIITLVRSMLADAYLSGDEVSFGIRLDSANGLCEIDNNSISYVCKVETNVQGKR